MTTLTTNNNDTINVFVTSQTTASFGMVTKKLKKVGVVGVESKIFSIVTSICRSLCLMLGKFSAHSN